MGWPDQINCHPGPHPVSQPRHLLHLYELLDQEEAVLQNKIHLLHLCALDQGEAVLQNKIQDPAIAAKNENLKHGCNLRWQLAPATHHWTHGGPAELSVSLEQLK